MVYFVGVTGRQENADGYTEFQIEVQGPDGSWTVCHRYNDFVELGKSLLYNDFVELGLKIPSKSTFRKNLLPGFMDERQRRLNIFVRTLVHHDPNIRGELLEHFLQKKIHSQADEPKWSLRPSVGAWLTPLASLIDSWDEEKEVAEALAELANAEENEAQHEEEEDDASPNSEHCVHCKAVFSKRRFILHYHCGICARSVCSACSPSKVQLDTGMQRVCTPCISNAAKVPAAQSRLLRLGEQLDALNGKCTGEKQGEILVAVDCTNLEEALNFSESAFAPLEDLQDRLAAEKSQAQKLEEALEAEKHVRAQLEQELQGMKKRSWSFSTKDVPRISPRASVSSLAESLGSSSFSGGFTGKYRGMSCLCKAMQLSR